MFRFRPVLFAIGATAALPTAAHADAYFELSSDPGYFLQQPEFFDFHLPGAGYNLRDASWTGWETSTAVGKGKLEITGNMGAPGKKGRAEIRADRPVTDSCDPDDPNAKTTMRYTRLRVRFTHAKRKADRKYVTVKVKRGNGVTPIWFCGE